MSLSPGGGRSPSAQPPPKDSPPAPPRRSREARGSPRTTWRAAWLAMLRWTVLIGGLVVIVDLGTRVMQQRTDGPEALTDLDVANQVSNVVLFSILGAVVARDTGVFWMAAVAGFLAALVDGLIILMSFSMAPIDGRVIPASDYLITNLAVGTIPAAVSGFVSSLVERMSGPRSK